MTSELSPDAQAILLLTAPLLIGLRAARNSVLPLSDSEYASLALRIRTLGARPERLLDDDIADLADLCADLIERSRLESLLARGFLLAQALERWQSRGIWVTTRADATYPKRVKTHLGNAAPPVLYGCGHVELLTSDPIVVLAVLDASDAALNDGSDVILVTAGLEQAALRPGFRAPLSERRLVLISPFDPSLRDIDPTTCDQLIAALTAR